MAVTSLDQRTALVLIDLQHGPLMTGPTTPHSTVDVRAHGGALGTHASAGPAASEPADRSSAALRRSRLTEAL